MKHIKEILLSQVPQKIKEPIRAPIQAIEAQTVKNLPETMMALKPLETKIMDFLFGVGIYHGYIYPSQISIANRFGKSRGHVNRLIGKLTRLKILKKKRQWNNSCVYIIDGSLFLKPNLERLHIKFPSLNKLMLYLCMIAPIAAYERNVTLTSIYRDIKNINYSIIAPSDKGTSMIQERPLSRVGSVIGQLPFELDTGQKVFLCGFTPEALEYAHEKLLLATGTLSSPWRFFLSKAWDYCRDENIPYKKALVDRLLQERGIAKVNFDSAQLVTKRPTLTQPVTKRHEKPIQKGESYSPIILSPVLPKPREYKRDRKQAIEYEIGRCFANIDKLRNDPPNPFAIEIRDSLIKKFENDIQSHMKDLVALTEDVA